MRIGIDLGTTRTIVAGGDRGNYPVLTVPDPDGDPQDHVPSVIALDGDRLVHGHAAVRAAQDGAPHLRSFKRLLADPEAHPGMMVRIGSRELPLLDLLTGFLAAVRAALPAEVVGRGDGTVPAAVSVPAHAHSAQRVMTLEAFRRAGFEVLCLLNEPSAAGFEFSHRQARSLTARRTRIAVYDLGGGTFDASLLETDGTRHEVLDSVGIARIGGDDVDVLLAELALRGTGTSLEDLDPAPRAALLEEARGAKERIAPQTRRILVERPETVSDQPALIPVEELYAAAAPLVDRTIEEIAPLVGALDRDSALAGIHLVGGATALPLVPRMLRERFGRRVHRSPYPAASTAIGLAIAADPDAGVTLTDRLSRGLGVFREREAGGGVAFDPILTRDAPLPESGVRTVTRRYRAAHDLGWFRVVEHGAVDAAGEPRGDLVPYADVLFPFDPALQHLDGETLLGRPVRRREDGPEVEEVYTVHPSGIVGLRITDLDTGHSREYGLAQRG
ncbi:Hsp70 family protein [Brachybacterium sp. J153]|uniref:Hsp70 family protein n=1 Tax=Brachybacterium sp. J153 TaxID=3116488 RepID=UPI002E79E257|nr:Hsp70 family protein [Brachybacterium sp. J153]MEE1619084.1 Hsp70 family protein [Brachybacterium sp. J153]